MAYILIIEDDDQLRQTLRQILERDGHEVEEAADGEAGVDVLRQGIPDLVVTDLIMPRKEGIETIQELRREYPGLRILAVSGGGMMAPGGPLADAEFFGADASLAKPFSLQAFRDTVAGLLED